MGKIIAICGKICSGKTFYANKIKGTEHAVILSCDELTKILFNNDLGEKHDEMSSKIWKYLLKKSLELAKINCNVILDWGFWSKESRDYIKKYFKTQDIVCEWHYIDISDKIWKKYIRDRNKKVLEGYGGNDYYLDEGLMNKLMSKWQEPNKDEIDVLHSII